MDPVEPQDIAGEALRGEHRDVVGALVDNHRAFLQFLERRVGDRALAEDILQDAFVRGIDRLERAGALEKEESVVAWFYRLLRNAVIDHHRRRGARESFAGELAHDEAPGAEIAGARGQCVRPLADTLKPEYAEALRRVELDGVPVQQLAAELGITPNNAAVRLFRAREALRRRVIASCGTCAAHGCLDCTCGQGACT